MKWVCTNVTCFKVNVQFLGNTIFYRGVCRFDIKYSNSACIYENDEMFQSLYRAQLAFWIMITLLWRLIQDHVSYVMQGSVMKPKINLVWSFQNTGNARKSNFSKTALLISDTIIFVQFFQEILNLIRFWRLLDSLFKFKERQNKI